MHFQPESEYHYKDVLENRWVRTKRISWERVKQYGGLWIKKGLLQTDNAMQEQLQKQTDGIFRFKNKIEQS